MPSFIPNEKHIKHYSSSNIHLFAMIVQIVGESGLFTPDDIAYVQEAGVKAVSTSYLDPWLPLLLHQAWSLRFCNVGFCRF